MQSFVTVLFAWGRKHNSLPSPSRALTFSSEARFACFPIAKQGSGVDLPRRGRCPASSTDAGRIGLIIHWALKYETVSSSTVRSSGLWFSKRFMVSSPISSFVYFRIVSSGFSICYSRMQEEGNPGFIDFQCGRELPAAHRSLSIDDTIKAAPFSFFYCKKGPESH